jgi:coenzyme F420 hydrogenase subunit beta
MTSAAIDCLGHQAVKAPISHLVWRDKKRPAYPGNPVVRTGKGEEILLMASQRMAIKDFFTPVRCRLCFDKLNVFADVVCGDPHGIKGIDRVGGETVVLVRTEAGREIVNSAKIAGAVELRDTPREAVVAGQGIGRKRVEWGCYIKAWQEMGYFPPSYHFASANDLNKIPRYRKLLEQGLALDKFASRDDLLGASETWVLRQKFKNTVLWPFAKLKRLLRLLRKENWR